MKYIHLFKWRIIILVLVVLFGGGNYATRVLAQGNIWHITVAGSDTTGDGSENSPFATIQHGIDVAANGDIVMVHPGVYKENMYLIKKTGESRRSPGILQMQSLRRLSDQFG